MSLLLKILSSPLIRSVSRSIKLSNAFNEVATMRQSRNTSRTARHSDSFAFLNRGSRRKPSRCYPVIKLGTTSSSMQELQQAKSKREREKEKERDRDTNRETVSVVR